MATYQDISLWLQNLNINEASDGTRQYLLAHGIVEPASADGKTFSLHSNYNSGSTFPASHHAGEVNAPVIAYFVDTSGEKHLVIIPESSLPPVPGGASSIYGVWKRIQSGSEEVFSIEETHDYTNIKTGQVIPAVTSPVAIDSNVTVSDINNTGWVFIEDAKYREKDYYTLQQQSGTTYQWKKKKWEPSDLKSSLFANFDATDSSSLSLSGSNINSWSAGGITLTSAGSSDPQYDSSFGPGNIGGVTMGNNRAFTVSASDFFSKGGESAKLDDLHIFLVLNISDGSATSKIISQAETASQFPSNDNGFRLTAYDDKYTDTPVIFENAAGALGTSRVISSAPVGTSSIRLIHACSSSSLGKSFIKINGEYTAEINRALSLISGEQLNIGSFNDSGSDGSTAGTIGQLIFIDAPLGNKEIQKIEGYLSDKWGFSLPVTHPYVSSAPSTLENSENLSDVDSELWTPKELGDDLKVWLDFSDKRTYVRESSDYYQNIAKIIDKSSAGHIFTADNSFDSKAPSQRFIDSADNALSTVNFASDDFYTSPSDVSEILGNGVNSKGERNKYSFHFVSKIEYVDSANDGILGIQDMSGTVKSFNLRAGVDTPSDPGDFYWESHMQYNLGYANNYSKNRTTNYADNQLNIFSCLLNGTAGRPQATLNVNGDFHASGSRQKAGLATNYRLHVNCNHNKSKGTDTQMGEFVATNTNNTSENQKIEGYLAHKWGLQSKLPSNHPHKLLPPYVEKNIRKSADVVDGYIFIGGSNMGGRAANSDLASDSYFDSRIGKTIYEVRYHDTIDDPSSALLRPSSPNAAVKGSTTKDSSYHGIELEFFRQYFGTKAQPAVLKYFIDDAKIADFNPSGSNNGWTALSTAISEFSEAVTGNGKTINWKGIIWFPDGNELNNTSYTSSLSTFLTALENLLIGTYGAENKIHHYLIAPQKHNGSGADDVNLATFNTALQNFANLDADKFMLSTTAFKTGGTGGMDSTGTYFNYNAFKWMATSLVNDVILEWLPEYSDKVKARYDFSDASSITASSTNISSITSKVSSTRNITLSHSSGTNAQNNATLNSKSAGEFAANTILETSEGILATAGSPFDDFSYFIVFQANGSSSNYTYASDRFLLRVGSDTEIEYKDADFKDAGSDAQKRVFSFNGFENILFDTHSLNQTHILEFTRSTGKGSEFNSVKTIRLDGKLVQEFYENDGVINHDTLKIGGIPMIIGEIVVAEGDLTTVERQGIEGYLARKWGKSEDLPSGHPYVSEDPASSIT